MTNEEVWTSFEPLFDHVPGLLTGWSSGPLLAHYTSLQVIEEILKTKTIWFSNPLNMNDYEELNFGIHHGVNALMTNQNLMSALSNETNRKVFFQNITHIRNQYSTKYLVDTYVFCLSEHKRENRDGLLSMWRGYGGNGRGAAIVFDLSKLSELPESIVILSKVVYGSKEKRLEWINGMIDKLASIINVSGVSDEQLWHAAVRYMERLKLFSLFTKHEGFSEEREWRAVYLGENDTDNTLSFMRKYVNGTRGIEPKLFFEMKPIEGHVADEIASDSIIHSIILGPSMNTDLSVQSTMRMLDHIHRPALKDRLHASSIPFRPA